MRRDRMNVATALMAPLLSVLVGFSGLMCLHDAFVLDSEPGLLLAVCTGVSLLALVAMLPRRSWPWSLLAAMLCAAGAIWQREAFLGSLRFVLFAITREYAQVYPNMQVVGAEIGDAFWVLALLGGLLAWMTTWVVTREGSAVLVLLAVMPVLVLCLMIVDLAPVLWLVLLTGGLMLLIMSHSVRERSPAEGSRLSWWLVLPTITLLSAITVLWPPADYVRADWSQALQNLAETKVAVQTWQEAVFTVAPRWNRELKTVDLSRVGPKILTGTPVLDYRSDGQVSYLRGVSLGIYEDNAWKAVPSGDFEGQASAEALQLPSAGGDLLLEVRTGTGKPQMYTTYFLSGLPEDGAAVDDAYVRNSQQRLTYSVTYDPWLMEPAGMPQAYDSFVAQTYTQVPEELAGPLREILQVNGLTGAYPEAVADYVRSLGRYDLNTPSIPAGTDFVLYFLQESRQGYCIHFASATVMLLRAAGIPARYVTGYAVDGPVDQWNQVTEDEAHAWVEYYAAGLGWLPLDPTPASEEAEQTPVTEPDVPVQTPENDTPVQNQTPDSPEQPPSLEETPLVDTGAAAQPLPQGLLWLLTVPGVLLAIWLRRWFGLRYRRERCRKGNSNRRALIWWRWLVQLSKARGWTISEELLCLAEKARFSQHTLTEEEIARLQQAVEAQVSELQQLPLGQRLWHRYGLVLY